MSLVLAGQLAGLAFACGLNLYLTVATLGILFRLGLTPQLPTGLEGLGGWIVIGSAVGLYLVEAVIDKVHHADSIWDMVHTVIRPVGAALLAVAVLWAEPAGVMALGAALAFFVALTVHGTKAGARMALNTTMHTRWQTWISVAEDATAAAVAVLALRFPTYSLIGVAAALLVAALFGPRLWGAFRVGNRATAAWLRAIFRPNGWRELDEMPRWTRPLLDDTPLGAAPPRGTRAALHGLKGAGAFRNGWLVLTVHGPVFVYRTIFGARRIPLPEPHSIEHEPGIWTAILHVRDDDDTAYTLFLLKDGPEIELAIQHLSTAAP